MGDTKKAAERLVNSFNSLSCHEQQLVDELVLSVTNTLQEITQGLERPTKILVQPVEQCQIIDFGSDVIKPLRLLKEDMEANRCELLPYLRRLSVLSDELFILMESNKRYFVSSPKVREHVRDITNRIIEDDVRAGYVLNTLLDTINDGNELA